MSSAHHISCLLLYASKQTFFSVGFVFYAFKTLACCFCGLIVPQVCVTVVFLAFVVTSAAEWIWTVPLHICRCVRLYDKSLFLWLLGYKTTVFSRCPCLWIKMLCRICTRCLSSCVVLFAVFGVFIRPPPYTLSGIVAAAALLTINCKVLAVLSGAVRISSLKLPAFSVVGLRLLWRYAGETWTRWWRWVHSPPNGVDGTTVVALDL